MALKKPGELFEEKIEVETPIDETPVRVEEPQEQTDNVFTSFASSLSEVIKELSEKVDTLESMAHPKPTGKTQKMNEDRLDAIEKTNQSLKGQIGVVEHRQQSINFDKVKNEVILEIKRLEDKIEIIKEAYEENILKEGLLNEPPSTDNEDPLTPLDKNYATLEDLNKHYRSFINRVQIQLSTIGGGGAVNIKDMDDVDSSALSNGKVLEYDSTLKKWKGGSVSGTVGNVVGVSTFNDDVKFNGDASGLLWDHSKNDLIFYNNTRLELGSNTDFQMWHGGTHTFMKNTGGDLRIRGNKILLKREDDSERYIECNVNNDVKLFYNGVEKFATTLGGVNVTGDIKVGTSQATGVILTSPNGTEYRLVVADNGTLSTTAV